MPRYDIMTLINSRRIYDKDRDFANIQELKSHYANQDIQILSIKEQVYTNPKRADQLPVVNKRQATIQISNDIGFKNLSVRCVKPMTLDNLTSRITSSLLLKNKKFSVKNITFSS